MKKNLITMIFLLGISTLMFAGTVQGFVTDVATGLPISGAKVHFTTNDGLHICYDAYTDANGFYSMDITNEIYNGRSLKRREYKVTLIEGIVVGDGVITIDFELTPTSGYQNN